jgi:hypothetical protein
MSSGYRLAPSLVARLLGLVLVLTAVLVVVTTLLAALLQWSPTVLLVSAVVAALAVLLSAWWLRRVEVVSLDEQGYRVRLVRGVGVDRGRWRDVADAVTGEARGIDCVVLRRKDGSTTSIPVTAVAGDRDRFVEDLREHLRRAEGLRPL